MDTVSTSEARTHGGAGWRWDTDDPTFDDEPKPSLDEIARALHARAVARAHAGRADSD
jgi:hypothetical protein